MRKPYTLVFIGMVLVMLDLKLNQFDLLPDALGFVLAALGCSALATSSKSFSIAALCAWLASLVICFGLFAKVEFLLPLGIASLVLECAFVWFLLSGVIDAAALARNDGLFQRAALARTVYPIVMILSFLAVTAFRQFLGAGLMIAGIVFLMVPLMLLLLNVLYRAQKELSPSAKRV
jgi:hypothetical protein